MLFSFECPLCKGRLETDSSLSGSQSECPQCGQLVAIPTGRIGEGATLAGYRLMRRLGKGGMGEVFLARQLSVDREVAVKVLPPGFAENRDAVRRFLREGRLAARLDHANIATVYEAGEDSGNYYLAMAYVDGESLDMRLKRDGVLPEAEALTIVRTVAEALAYAWETFQLLHRDIKPGNIMVDTRHRVFLMDLGLAKSLGEESDMTLSGAVLGTPQYMSPEQAQGESKLHVPSDIYSLGATLYHLATGAPPFVGDSVLKVLQQHVHSPLPPLRERNPKLSEGCERLVQTMMAKQARDRFADWSDLIRETDRVIAGETSPEGIRPPSLVPARGTASAGVQSESLKPPAASSALSAPSRPARALSLAIAATGIVFLSLLGAYAWRQRSRGDEENRETTTKRVIRSQPPAASPVAESGPPAASPVEENGPPAQAPSIPVLGKAWTAAEIGMDFVWIERLGLWVGKYEVTNGEYRRKESRHVSKNHGQHSLNGDRQPVTYVSWMDACAYAKWLTVQERKAGRLPPSLRYRLPTLDEFLTYIQCGDGREYPWGNEWPPPSNRAGNYSGQESMLKKKIPGYQDNHVVSCEVQQAHPNPWGLCGVGGNAWEICAGNTEPTQSYGGLTGASWFSVDQESIRCSFQLRTEPPSTRSFTLGFRLVLAGVANSL